MTYLSIIEKFKVLFDMFWDFKFILIFTVVLLLFTIIYGFKVINNKKYMLYMFISFILVFSISIFSNYKVLSKTFDNFMTIFFENIYFPSIYVYIGVLVVSFISFVVSIFNVMLKKAYKIINCSMFVVNNILFVIVLNIIAKSNIDIFSVTSLYTNTNLVVILELSMGLCILWILSIITVFISDIICNKLSSKKVCNEDVQDDVSYSPVIEIDNAEVYDTPSVNEDIVYAIGETSFDDTVSFNEEYRENKFIFNPVIEIDNTMVNNNEESVSIFNDVLNGNIPVNYYDTSNEIKEDNVFNPQVVYENKYSEGKDNNKDMLTESNSIFANVTKESVIERTLLEKEKVKEERLIVNTVSLNDLIEKEETSITTVETEVDESDTFGYSIDDYKKMVKMLRALKIHSNSTNIKIDDAVAISLISNYSIDDCMKLKNMLKGNFV